MFREGLQNVLQAMDSDLQVFQAGSIEQTDDLLKEHQDVAMLLIDLEMPVHDGFYALDYFSQRYLTLPCVILSSSTKRSDAKRALDSGAMGYICKSTQSTSLYNAIKLILEGEIYVPYEIMLAERRVNRVDDLAFTQRQKQVIKLMMLGEATKVIANELELAEATVKMHLSAIFTKLKVHNRSAAISKINSLRIQLD
jgi:DNA-binding NarL/FixJ family response regulator